jgi:hypothetical protein
MQSFITGCVKNKYYLYDVLTLDKIRHINIIQETYNHNNENIVILENYRKKSNLD